MSRHATWFLLALLPLAACKMDAGSPAMSGPGAADQGFAQGAASADLFEVQSSQLAVGRARRPAVRAYAQRLIDSHAARSQKLAALAGQKGFTLSTTPDPAQQRTLAELDGNRGSFDAAYVAAQAAAHQSAISAARSEAANGRDPDLKAFAQATLPDLQEHLAMAQRLRGGR